MRGGERIEARPRIVGIGWHAGGGWGGRTGRMGVRRSEDQGRGVVGGPEPERMGLHQLYCSFAQEQMKASACVGGAGLGGGGAWGRGRSGAAVAAAGVGGDAEGGKDPGVGRGEVGGAPGGGGAGVDRLAAALAGTWAVRRRGGGGGQNEAVGT